jgi:ATP-dependent RNA helicase DHX29
MGKKKLALKRKVSDSLLAANIVAVQRGFATTSVPTKKAKEAAQTSKEEAQEVKPAEAPTTQPESPQALVRPEDHDAWDSATAIDDAVYQGLVDRLQEKGDKDVARIVKAGHKIISADT